MCRKVAILPIFSIIIAFLFPKQAFASHPKETEKRLVFKTDFELDLKDGIFSKKIEENLKLENSNTVSAPEKKLEKTKESLAKPAKTIKCSETGFESEKCRVFTIVATGYSSTVDQCDSDPFTTASGKHVHFGTLAANFLPFGTSVLFPEYFGDRVFVVEDRMNARFSNRMDIWFESRREAIGFGKRTITAVVIK